MNRFKSIALFLCTGLFAGTTVIASAGQPGSRPNILWILSEDLSPFMGCYNDPINTGHTPSIDKLAESGVLFTRAFASAPVCSASRSALITGIMQTTTGTHNHRSCRTTEGVVPEEARIYLPDGMKTLPELMRAAGYFTFNSGKDDYNFHYDRRALYNVGTKEDYEAGVNGWQGNFAVDYISFNVANWSDRPDKSQPWFGQMQINGGKAGNKFVRKGEQLADNDVELPPYFPDTSAHRKAWTGHYNANRGADVRVQQILDQLKADGELENTIVFFFSDHGSNTSLRHKQFCYEGGMHVPLMIAGNHAWLKEGTLRDELVSLLDVSATTLAMAGIAVPDFYDGQNLFGKAYKPVEYVLGARDRCDFTIDTIRTVRSDTYRYIRNYHPERSLSQPQYRDKQPVVKDMRKLYEEGKLTPYQEEHWFGERPEEELYDLAADPHQTNNLAADPAFASVVKEHRNALEQWQKQHGDKGLQPEPAGSLRGTYELWKDKPQFKNAKVNPEYDQFR